MSESVLVDAGAGVGVVTVNRPEVRNALDGPTFAALRAAVAKLDADPGVSPIIITGAGEKSFVSGADLNALRSRSAPATLEGLNSKILAEIEACGKPTIAAINGFALGGGLELAMACDLRVAAETAKMGQTELNLGILPGAGGTQRLTRLVGLGKAKELIFTGKVITAAEALAIGLVNAVAPAGKLMEEAAALAASIASKSPYILRLAKIVINAGASCDLASALAIERLGQTAAFGSKDHLEGIGAFLEKRQPRFTGE